MIRQEAPSGLVPVIIGMAIVVIAIWIFTVLPHP
jgi:hypothetical protein